MLDRRKAVCGLLAGALISPRSTWAGPQAPPLLQTLKASEQLEVARYLVSEKLNGVRGYWDGRRMLMRSGLLVALPGWFAALPPPRSLDCELWKGRGRLEAASAAVRRRQRRELRYMLFKLPNGAGSFEQRAQQLQQLAGAAGLEGLQALPQTRLDSQEALRHRLQSVLRDGGEGLMLHQADAPYVTGRREVLLKLKAQDDAEAVVLAHLPGQGRYACMLGALPVRNEAGQEFLLGSGFSQAQRRAPPPVGCLVTYRYRGLGLADCRVSPRSCARSSRRRGKIEPDPAVSSGFPSGRKRATPAIVLVRPPGARRFHVQA